ncbi:hypothetical protein O3M35_002136 [Rhynocoris fuscipes]|uniref:Uncharacterized protein n=1 Tax=Rhynocoris fuscipes TaxID=488301 RepID=A0AAW1CXH9_9HEMI
MPQINFPQIRFPKFPEHIKKPFKKAKVTETTTVYIEVTKRVTRHPICVTAYLPKPPCLNNYYYDELRDVENDYEESYVQEEPKLAIEPTRVVELPTVRGAELISSSDEETVAVTDDLEQKSEDYNKRNARYLVPHPPLNFETDDEVEENGRIIKKDFLKNTHYVTKSIIVTKVEKTFDHRVTATLVAKNCIPSAPRFPHCGKFHHPIIGGGIHNNNNNKEWKDKEEEHENEQQSIKKANKSLNYQHSN